MNVKTTVILLVLVVLCAAYVIVFHAGWFGPGDKPATTTEDDNSLTPKVGKVQRLELDKPGEPRIALVRRDDTWHLAEPVDAPAIAWKADGTVSTVSTLRYARRHAPRDADFPKDDLTHLSAPLRIATFTDDKNATYTLKVGRKVSLSKQTYVQLAGDDRVYVVDADLAETLKKTANDYRETAVAKFDTAQAVRVDVRGKEAFQLVKVDDKWAIDRPVAARADQDKVKSLLDSISGISAEKFVNDAPAPQDLSGYGLDAPRLAVTVELAAPKPTTAPAASPAATGTPTRPAPEKGKTITVVFGKIADKKVFARLARRPWVFQVPESKLTDLQPKLIELRDKGVLELAGKEVSRIEAAPPGDGPIKLEKLEYDWRMSTPFQGACDGQAVEKLITSLKDLKAEGFVDKPPALAAYGLAPPAGAIVLHFRGSDKTTTLQLGRKSPSGQTGFVRDAAGKSVAAVKSDDYDALCRSAAGYWTRTILELPRDAEIVQVDLDRPEGKFTVRRGESGGFKLTRPVAAATDEDNVKALLAALREVQADEIVALEKGLPERFAKGKPIRVAVAYRTPLPPPATAPASRPATAPSTQPATSTAPTTQPASQPARYRTHPGVALLVVKQGGKSFAWKEGASPIAVGKLDGEFHEKLAAEMRERTILKVEPGAATSLTVDVEEDSLEFVRSGKQWRYTADTFAKVDAGKIKEFLAELAKIKAVRFVDYGDKPDLKRFGLDKPFAAIAVKTDSGEVIRLSVAKTGPGADRHAAGSQVPGVFVLAGDDAAKLRKTLKDFASR